MQAVKWELLHLLCALNWTDEQQAMAALQRWLCGPFSGHVGLPSVLWRAFLACLVRARRLAHGQHLHLLLCCRGSIQCVYCILNVALVHLCVYGWCA